MRQDDSDVEMDGGEADEEVVREKDEMEKKLERMLFGDDEGFQDALKSQQDRGLMALGAISDEESAGESGEEGEDEDGEEKGLEDVDDADVGSLPFITFLYDVWLTVEAILPRFWRGSCLY